MAKTFISFVGIVSKLSLALVIAGSARADLYTYTYSGPSFDTYYLNSQPVDPFPVCCVLGYPNVSASATFSQPLSPYSFVLDLDGSNIVGADSLVQWNIGGVVNQGELELETDANGSITGWYLGTYVTPGSDPDQSMLFETTPGFDEISNSNDAGSQVVIVSDAVGTWSQSITATPEPGANPAFKITSLLLLMLGIGFWRKQKIDLQNWWPETGSNRRHADFQSAALPTELPGHTNRF